LHIEGLQFYSIYKLIMLL